MTSSAIQRIRGNALAQEKFASGDTPFDPLDRGAQLAGNHVQRQRARHSDAVGEAEADSFRLGESCHQGYQLLGEALALKDFPLIRRVNEFLARRGFGERSRLFNVLPLVVFVHPDRRRLPDNHVHAAGIAAIRLRCREQAANHFLFHVGNFLLGYSVGFYEAVQHPHRKFAIMAVQAVVRPELACPRTFFTHAGAALWYSVGWAHLYVAQLWGEIKSGANYA